MASRFPLSVPPKITMFWEEQISRLVDERIFCLKKKGLPILNMFEHLSTPLFPVSREKGAPLKIPLICSKKIECAGHCLPDNGRWVAVVASIPIFQPS